MKPNRSISPAIELLEARIAPAGIITITPDGKTATWDDIDGDKATLKVTKGVLTDALFTTDQTFTTGLLVTKLNLTDVQFKGTGVSLLAKRDPRIGGDAQVNIGYIDATGLPLGAVKISGDLARIDAGDPVITPKGPKAITSLAAFSMGATDGATLPAGVTSNSEITGKVGAIAVRGNIVEAYINVGGGDAGSIDALTIGGHLIGTDEANSGRISASGKIGKIDIKGNIYGGSGQNSGSVDAGMIGTVSVLGSIFGGRSNNPSTDGTGVIRSDSTLGSVSIGGNLHGGSQQDSGLVSSAGNAGTIKVLGGIIGGSAGSSSGGIFIGGNSAGVSIKGDVLGGAALESGVIQIGGKAGLVSLLGSLTGGAGEGSGSIIIGTDVSDTITGLSIGRDVKGGAGERSGSIVVEGKITSFAVKGTVHGGDGDESGFIDLASGAGTATISGDIEGGNGLDSGRLQSSGVITTLTLGGNLLGGNADGAGSIVSSARIGKFGIGGSVLGPDLAVGATDDVVGSGLIQAGAINTLTIGGALRVGVDASAVADLINTAAIRVANEVGSLTISRGVEGTAETPVFITARGQEILPPNPTTDTAFKSINIGGVRFANILAGYDTTTDATLAESNPNASINNVGIRGDWVASNLVAGAKWSNDFGDSVHVKATGVDDPKISARILNIAIGGQIVGTANSTTDHYGFVAEYIRQMTIGTTVKAIAIVPGSDTPAGPAPVPTSQFAVFLSLGRGNDNDLVSNRYNLASTFDVRVFEFI